MPIDTWFPLAIYYEDLPAAAHHKQSLIEAVLQLEQEGHAPRNYPEMAWTGDLHGVEKIHTDPRFAWIVQQVEAHTVTYLKELGLDLSWVDLFIQRAWPVVSRHQQEVGAHCHNTANISAVVLRRRPQIGQRRSRMFDFFSMTPAKTKLAPVWAAKTPTSSPPGTTSTRTRHFIYPPRVDSCCSLPSNAMPLR